MSGSGLIYVAVLSAWALYLLTRCLKTTPADTSSGSREGKLLSRRGAGAEPAATYSMLRPVPAEDVTPVVKTRRVDSPVTPAPAPPRPISRATALRRRRLIRTLLLATLGLAVPAAFGLLPAWPAAVPGALLLAYLYELRVQVRRAQLARALAEAPVTIPAPRTRAARKADRDDAAWDPWELAAESFPAGPVADLADGWEPRPVPLPTYVTAPKAPPVIRRIDVSAGRPWAAADDDTQEIPVITVELAEIPTPRADSDDAAEPLRAVNE